MRLDQFLKINSNALVADAVNFGMMADQEKNLELCKGFVFSYNQNKPKQTTVGILEALKRSYQSRNESNVHLLVQDYGKGKSHFGLVLANFFKQAGESPELQGIFHQIKLATSGNQTILEELKAYKKRNPKHLVICLSGEKGDLKQLLLTSIRQTLEAENLTNSIASRLCGDPLKFLKELTPEQKNIAEKYLKSINNPYGDLSEMIELLEQDNYQVIPTVIEISSKLYPYPLNFEANLDIENILKDLIENLCTGPESPFAGILILLDELNAYLQSWANNSAAAGGLALQNITNICENYKGKIALLSLTQIKPSNANAIPRTSKESYKKLTSRLELNPSTYEPVSSLELVLSKLILPENQRQWQQFITRWDSTLLAESRNAYEKRITVYRERQWQFSDFHTNFALPCFPLHPLTAYLLCNLDFTQGRTAIQFIKEDVKNFIQQQEIEIDGRLNYIPPVALVDAFLDNFSNHSKYNDYDKAYYSIIASASPEQITILKAIFLFYVAGSKLTKTDNEKHEEILQTLTGLPLLKIQQALEELSENQRVIYKLPNNIYGFYSGFSIKELEREIEDNIKQDENTGRKRPNINDVLTHCRNNRERYFRNSTVTATQFVEENKLIEPEWKFEYQISTPTELESALQSDQTLRNTQEKGIIACIIAETEDELQSLKEDINHLLSKSPISSQIVVAIPRQGTNEIARQLLKLQKLREKTSDQKLSYGTAFEQLVKEIDQKITQQLTDIFKTCTYHSTAEIHPSDQNKLERIISALLNKLYRYIPPVESIDKMAPTSTKGSQIISFVSKRILAGDLTPQGLPDNAYKTVLDPIFVDKWRLLQKTSQNYSVIVPTHPKIEAAWNEISTMTELKNQSEKAVDIINIWKKLSSPPYGYNEFTFTILFSAWLAYHRQEVSLRGSFGIPTKKEQASIQTKPIKDWTTTNILDKPKEFVNTWITQNSKPRLIRRRPSPYPQITLPVDFEQAETFLPQIEKFLQNPEIDEVQKNELTAKQKQIKAGIKQINDWLTPILETENLNTNATLENLLKIYTSLRQPLAKTDVNPTQQQRNRHFSALQLIQQKINQFVSELSQRCNTLTTEKDCIICEVEIDRSLQTLKTIPDLPIHLTQTLETAKQNSIKAHENLKQQTQTNETESPLKNILQEAQNQLQRICDLTNLSEAWEIYQSLEKTTFPETITPQENQHKLQDLKLQGKNQIATKFNQLSNQTLHHLQEYEPQKIQLQNSLQLLSNSPDFSDIQNILSNALNRLETQREQLQKQQKDNQIIQQIRTYKPAPSTTLHQCEIAIQEIEKQTAGLHFLENYQTEIDQLLQTFKNQISSHLNKLQQLHQQIAGENPITLDNIQTEYTKLDWIFKDSSHYQAYQQFQQEIDNIKLQNRENQILEMFQQLPPEQRLNLFKKLSAYL